MAREQTQDLPTRGLRPANVQAGQYRVAVQQAPESKLMGLARGLTSVNRGLEAYTNMGGTLNEMFEEEIGEMNLEQVEKERLKMEKRLDGAERKGLIPFLGNPLNWERSRKAIGRRYAALLHDQTVSNEGRFYKGRKEGDADLTVGEILDQEREKFLGQQQGLMQNPMMMQAFESEWQRQSNVLQQRFSDQKQREFIQNIASDTSGQLHNLVKVVDYSNLNEKTRASIDKQASEIWAATGSLSRTNQEKVIKSVATSLARINPQRALDFLEVAKKNLSVGAVKLSDEKNTQMFDELEDLIGDVWREEEKESGNTLDEERKKKRAAIQDESRKLYDQYRAAVFNMETLGKWQWSHNGKTYTDREVFQSDFELMLANMQTEAIGSAAYDDTTTIVATVRGEMEQFVTGRGSATQQSIFINQTRVDKKIANAKQALGSIVNARVNNIKAKEIQLVDVQRFTDWNSSYADELDQLELDAESFFNATEGSRQEKIEKTNEFINTKIAEWNQRQMDELVEIEQQAISDKLLLDEQRAGIQNAQANGEPIETLKLKDKELIQALNLNYNLIATSPDTKIQRQAAKYLYQWYDTNKVKEILMGNTPKVSKGRDRYGNYINEVQYTEEELDEFEKLYLKIETAKGIYTDLHLFPKSKNQVKGEERYTITQVREDDWTKRDSIGYEVNIKDLSTKVHRILTEGELNTPNANSVKRKAEMLGKPVKALIEDQRQLYKDNKQAFELFQPTKPPQ